MNLDEAYTQIDAAVNDAVRLGQRLALKDVRRIVEAIREGVTEATAGSVGDREVAVRAMTLALDTVSRYLTTELERLAR